MRNNALVYATWRPGLLLLKVARNPQSVEPLCAMWYKRCYPQVLRPNQKGRPQRKLSPYRAISGIVMHALHVSRSPRATTESNRKGP